MDKAGRLGFLEHFFFTKLPFFLKFFQGKINAEPFNLIE